MADPRPRADGDQGRWILAGLVGAAVAPVLVLAFGAPVWAGVGLGLAAFAGIGFAPWVRAALGRPLPSPALSGPTGAGPVHRLLTEEAGRALDRLAASAPRVADAGLRQGFLSIAAHAEAICADLEAHPGRLPEAQRLLAYYAPRLAELAEAVADLGLTAARDPARVESLAALLAKAEAGFRAYHDARTEDALRALDVDMRLMRDALAEDAGRG